MNDCMKTRLEKINSELSDLRSQFIKVENQRLELIKQQPQIITHKKVNLNIQHYESWMN